MTSRTIERHKNYYDIMRRHNKKMHNRRLTKTLIYIIFVLGLAVVLYLAIDKLERVENNDKNSGRNVIEFLPKIKNYGNEKEPPEKCLQVNQFMV